MRNSQIMNLMKKYLCGLAVLLFLTNCQKGSEGDSPVAPFTINLSQKMITCFPKDVKALIKTAEQNGYRMRVLQAVEEVNEKQKSVLFEKLQRHFSGDLQDKTIALWGLAFKPETDDMREAPSLILINKLLNAGCKVRVYDPAAMTECRRRIGDSVCYATDMYDAALDADALMLVTEWKEFRLPSWAVIKKAMRTPVLLDGRNIYEKKEIEELGFTYHCIGK